MGESMARVLPLSPHFHGEFPWHQFERGNFMEFSSIWWHSMGHHGNFEHDFGEFQYIYIYMYIYIYICIHKYIYIYIYICFFSKSTMDHILPLSPWSHHPWLQPEVRAGGLQPLGGKGIAKFRVARLGKMPGSAASRWWKPPITRDYDSNIMTYL